MTHGQYLHVSIVQAVVEGHLQDADWQASSRWTNAYLKNIAVCSLKAPQAAVDILFRFYHHYLIVDTSLQCVLGSRVRCGSLHNEPQRDVLLMLPPCLLLQQQLECELLTAHRSSQCVLSQTHTHVTFLVDVQ